MSDPKQSSAQSQPTGERVVPIKLGTHAGWLIYCNRMFYRLGLLSVKPSGEINYTWACAMVWAMLDPATARQFAGPEDLTDHITPANWPEYAAKILEAYKAAGVGETAEEKKSTKKGG